MPILNEVNHRPESRMRENRQYGSEGGETGQPVFPTPITPISQEVFTPSCCIGANLG